MNEPCTPKELACSSRLKGSSRNVPIQSVYPESNVDLDFNKACVLSSEPVVAKDKVAPESAQTLIERVGSYLPEDNAAVVGPGIRLCRPGPHRADAQIWRTLHSHPLQTALFLADLHLWEMTPSLPPYFTT
ncbi:MAG: hypothetical protein CM1200mP27_03910 [Chloroflexota bacterium]|nr:MAG: hypothetical protein CM1200mP27_03910 [Chloroflexota bacterium]